VSIILAVAKELSRAGCCTRCGSELGGGLSFECSKCGCPVQAAPAKEDCACTKSSLSLLFTGASLRTREALADEQEVSPGEDASISKANMEEGGSGSHAIGSIAASNARAIPRKEDPYSDSGSATKTQEISEVRHLQISPWRSSSTPRDRIRALVLQAGPFTRRNTRSQFKSLPSPPCRQLSEDSSNEDDEDQRQDETDRAAIRRTARKTRFHAEVPSVAMALKKPPLPPRPRHLVLSAQQATADRERDEISTAERTIGPKGAEAIDEVTWTQDEDDAAQDECSEHDEQVLLGLKWEEVDEEEAVTGAPISNPLLAQALEQKYEFTLEELHEMHVSNLSKDSYIVVCERYYKPIGREQGPMTWFDFFLTGKGLLAAYAMMIAIVFLSVAIAYFVT